MSQVKMGLIGGSGLGEVLRTLGEGTRHEVETPFGKPSDAIVETAVEGLGVFFLARHGPGHILNPTQVPYRANIFALKKLGVTHIIASGAVGSLRDEFKPRDLVIADQIIDKTYKRPNTFYEHAAVHVEFAEPFCAILRQKLIEEGRVGQDQDKETGSQGEMEIGARAAGGGERAFRVHGRGCYVCMEGPAFSTRAESMMNRLLGGDLIGMTCMPEAKLAREAEIAYALIALVTDYDCWRRVEKPPEAGAAATGPGAGAGPDPAALLEEIIANLGAASDNAVMLIRRVLGRVARNPDALAGSKALSALKLAIWTQKDRVAADQVELLAPLWKKYFQTADG
jgi:5'-methylthioadenosine phosphorylase